MMALLRKLARIRVHWEDGTYSPPAIELADDPPQVALHAPLSLFDDIAPAAVPIGTLRATQNCVRTRTVRALLDGALAGCAPILVVEYGAARYIRDGHHRATAHALQGDYSIQARVLRVEPQ